MSIGATPVRGNFVPDIHAQSKSVGRLITNSSK
jgi:hypothetical protein